MILLKKVRQCCECVDPHPHAHIVAANLRGVTRLSQSYAEPPLCIRQPRPVGCVAQAYISTLGGGLLSTDSSRLQVEVAEGAQLFLGSQSANRVFKSRGATSQQKVEGSVAAGALLVHFPDAMTPFAHSRMNQSQVWSIAEGGRLALGEIFQAGRISRGEIFALSSFQSEWRLENSEGKPMLLDRISLEPGRMDLHSPGCLGFPDLAEMNVSAAPGELGPVNPGVFTQWASFAFCGPGWDYLETDVLDAWRQSRYWPWGVAGPDDEQESIQRDSLVSLWRKDENVVMARILSRNRIALDKAIRPIYEALASSRALGFSPWARKY
jgi:urease accessory protein UreH